MVIVRYHIPRDGGRAENRTTVIERVPGLWEPRDGAVVDQVIITDERDFEAAIARHPAGSKL